MRDGVVVIDKPVGPTSHDVVERVKRALHAKKAGHTGTLDPLATGVLPICLGEAVKLQQFLAEGDKAYEARVAFGSATTTEDAAGEVTVRADASALTREAILAALPRFVGEIEQVPPMFSAVRVAGRRLHQSARAGEEVEREARKVVVHELALSSFEGGEAVLTVRCGKGTYVRTLAKDLGAALGLPAHLAGLRRTAAGPFTLADAVPLDAPAELMAAGVLPLPKAFRHLPAAQLTSDQVRALRTGKALPGFAGETSLAAALDPAGNLVAVCRRQSGRLQPVRVLAPR